MPNTYNFLGKTFTNEDVIPKGSPLYNQLQGWKSNWEAEKQRIESLGKVWGPDMSGYGAINTINYYSPGGAGFNDALRDYKLALAEQIAPSLGLTGNQLYTNPSLYQDPSALTKYKAIDPNIQPAPTPQIYYPATGQTQNPLLTNVPQTQFGNSSYTGNSIVDYLKSVGQTSDYASRVKLASQYGISNYMGTADQNLQLLGLLRGQVKKNDNISTSSIAENQTKITIPSLNQDATDYSGLLGANISTMPSWLKNTLSTIEKPKDLTETYKSFEEQAGIEGKQKEVNDLTAQLTDIQNKAKEAQLTLEQQAGGRDITGTFLGNQQQEITRQAAIKSLPIQTQLAIAQGNLEVAQEKVNTLFKIQSDYEDRLYNYQKEIRGYVYDWASKEQQQIIDQQQEADDRIYQDKKDMLNYAQQLSVVAINNGQGDLARKIMALDYNSPSYSDNLAILSGQIKKEEIEVTKSEKRDIAVEQYLQGKKGTDGFVSAQTYQEGLRKFIANGGTQSNFFASFPQQSYLRQEEINNLPAGMKPQMVTTKSDLSADQLGIINDAKAAIDQVRQRWGDWEAVRQQIIEQSKQQYNFDIAPYI
ncbi:MAG: hypothetical protein PHT54_03520 [Candidatus Nanoarchaeia archaeon]|nr:hypothetical protein [Candidatus Nanoarchaeia archaeon]